MKANAYKQMYGQLAKMRTSWSNSRNKNYGSSIAILHSIQKQYRHSVDFEITKNNKTRRLTYNMDL